MTTTIYAPSGVNGETYIGPVVLQFAEGVAKYDGDLPEGALTYMRSHGYGIDKAAEPLNPDVPDVPDPRNITLKQVGTVLRDAAVDPDPAVDFLPPVNAGDANPHGPTVVSPGIHAASTAKPIAPGPVGSVGEDSDGNPVVVKDTAAQAEKETSLAQAVLVDQTPVPEATADAAKIDPINEDQLVPEAGPFDPSEHTVAEVQAHIADASNDEKARVLAAEGDGKARTTLVGGN